MSRKIITTTLVWCLMASSLLLTNARGSTPLVGSTNTETANNLDAGQLDNLLAPIALYPDPLLAQMLPAATYVDQIDAAARYLRANNNSATGVENQSWDVSVKSIAHYPQVIFYMSEKLDWTTALGQAYVTQSPDLFKSIQRLRARAKEAGYLTTTPQQTVIVEKEVIKVVPAQPQYIYVPTYDPQVVYVQSSSSGVSTGAVVATAAIAFGAGLLIGAWLNNDCDWHSYHVYYHGWRGTGWVHVSSVHVHHYNSYYVNARYTTVRHNTAIVNRPVNYNNISHYNSVHRNVTYNNVNVNNINRNNVNVNNVNRNNVNTNISNKNVNKNINTNDINADKYRGKNTGPSTRPANQPVNRPATQPRTSAFGSGGANRSQTMQQSQRGQTSRSSYQKNTAGRQPASTRSGSTAGQSGGKARTSGGTTRGTTSGGRTRKN